MQYPALLWSGTSGNVGWKIAVGHVNAWQNLKQLLIQSDCRIVWCQQEISGSKPARHLSHLIVFVLTQTDAQYVFFESGRAHCCKLGSLRDTLSFPCLLFKLASSNPVLIYGEFHYICWALSSSTDSSSSFIWLLSSSSWDLASSGSGRALLPSDAPSELDAATGLGLASVPAMVGLWSDGDWDKVFVEGCEEKKRTNSTWGMNSIPSKDICSKHVWLTSCLYSSNEQHRYPASRIKMFLIHRITRISLQWLFLFRGQNVKNILVEQ